MLYITIAPRPLHPTNQPTHCAPRPWGRQHAAARTRALEDARLYADTPEELYAAADLLVARKLLPPRVAEPNRHSDGLRIPRYSSATIIKIPSCWPAYIHINKRSVAELLERMGAIGIFPQEIPSLMSLHAKPKLRSRPHLKTINAARHIPTAARQKRT